MFTFYKVVFACDKWADCTCSKEAKKCACGESCTCGTVPISSVNTAIETVCPKADCSCGLACGCPKDACTACGGSQEKAVSQWIEAVKLQSEGALCACTKNDKPCPCPADSPCSKQSRA